MDSAQIPLTISIVTPSYNQAVYLGRTMDSVISQDYPHVEYVVMDGGSNDGSVELIRQRENRISDWRSEKDQGQADAIAKGFGLCTGDVMGWLNSDDLLLPGALSSVAEFFRDHPEAEVVSGGAYCIDSEGRPLRKSFGSYTLGVAATYGRFRYYHLDGVFQQSTFWRRSAYEAVGGLDQSLKFILDRDLFLRLAKRRPFTRLPRMLACFRIHETCKSVCIQDVRQHESKVFRERYGTDRYGAVIRNLLYYRYRIPSLARKVWLRTLLECGHIKLERVA